MYTKLTTNDIAQALISDEYADWTHEGAQALAEWIEEVEEDLECEPWEFDACAFRCFFTEYASDEEALAEYDYISTMKRLRDETIVIDVPGGGVIVQDF